jgi:hypothetical protein
MGKTVPVTDEKDPVEKVLDLFVYAPLGFAMSMRQLLPELAEKGRQHVTGQVTMAKMIGQFAVQQGTNEAEKAFGRARTSAQSTLEQLGVLGGENGSAPATTPAATPPPVEVVVQPLPTPAPAAAPAAPRPSADGLAIPDYDSLSASQVIPRLAGLAPAELEAVRVYEAAHRGRKTIMNKVGQLQAS